MIHFRYNGEAVGKGRPRVTARGGKFAHAYTPKRTKEFEDAIRFEFMASTSDPMPVYPKGTPLQAKILIGCAIPKSYSKKKQAQCREGILVPDKKPDLDNICKAVLDALQGNKGRNESGYAFDDDSQVVKLVAEKIYSDEPFVEVTIDEL